jgi:rhomboid protease GluP
MFAFPVTLLLIGVLALIFASEMWLQVQYYGWAEAISPQILVDLGANYPPALLAGEYWRLLTSCFLHVSFLHLLMNSYALYLFGPMVERNFGRGKLIQTFLVTGMLGSLATNVLHRSDGGYISAGASGAIFGLFGVIFFAGKYHAKRLPKELQSWLNQNMLLLVGMSFAPQIDKWGHFGGLAAGLLLGWSYVSQHRGSAPPLTGEVKRSEDPHE